MAIIDIDRHILLELTILIEKMRTTAIDFKIEWETIISVREKTAFIMNQRGLKDDPELGKLRDQIYQATKICNTKLAVMDDCESRMAALLNYLVTFVEKADTKKGRESYGSIDPIHCDSLRD